jgi:hypothetical protein
MSLLLQQIFQEIDRLSLQDQIEVLTYAANRVKLQISNAKPKYRVTELLDIAPGLQETEDDRESVDRSMKERCLCSIFAKPQV